MSKTHLVLIAGGLTVLLAAVGFYQLKTRYCWPCSDLERLERGSRLVCQEPVAVRQRGLQMIRTAADRDDPGALALLGELYLKNLPPGYRAGNSETLQCADDLVGSDPEKARFHFRRLIDREQLSPPLEHNLGLLLREGMLGPERAVEKANAYFQRAAAGGYPPAMFELGMLAWKAARYPEAERWFSEAYRRGGHPGAALVLGDYQLQGRGGKVDAARAVFWYRKALGAAQRKDAAEVDRGVARAARYRLQIAEGRLRQQPIRIGYALQGGIDHYRVLIREAGETSVGTVSREGEAAIARFFGKGNRAKGGEEFRAESMNAGLHWLLNRYAAARYGADRPARFVLQPD